MKDPKRILIVDGDLLAYVCAAAAEERSILVTHKPTGINKSFKTRTAFKESMKKRNKEITDDYSIEDQQEAESPAFCFKVIRQKIEKLKKIAQADEVEVWCEDVDNFRLHLPLPSLYKGQRASMLRPLLLKDAKDYLRRTHNAQRSYGMETDDSVNIRAYEELEKGNIPIISSFDKDSTQADGIYILNENKKDPKPELMPELGELTFEKTKGVKGTGLKFLCFQWLWGDPSDNYKGSELANAGFGNKSAYDLLVDCQTVKECLEVVISKYKEWYPEPFEYKAWNAELVKADWKFLMRLYFKCAYMKRSRDDNSEPDWLFEKYGVVIE